MIAPAPLATETLGPENFAVPYLAQLEDGERSIRRADEPVSGGSISSTRSSTSISKRAPLTTCVQQVVNQLDSDTEENARRAAENFRWRSQRASSSKKLQEPYPRLSECAHFHYDSRTTEDAQVDVALSKYVSPPSNASGFARASTSSSHSNSSLVGPVAVGPRTTFRLTVVSRGDHWSILRTLDNVCDFDTQLHSCVFDRRFTQLQPLILDDFEDKSMKEAVSELAFYFARLTEIGFGMVTCAPLLNWLELDNRGYHIGGPSSSSLNASIVPGEDAAINTPAIAAAHVVKSYLAEAPDELSLQQGDIVSVIDMPALSESVWWRGKKDFKVGFFPCHCVELIDGPKSLPASLQDAHLKPVFRKRGKVVSFFRVFFLSRPSRRELKKRGILRERVFGCDLAEHLQNVGEEVPIVLKACCSFIEKFGIVDGIYRLSGIVSNIQKLRNSFDENRVPDMTEERYLQDIHCVTSLLKMYLRELPNPLLTYQLYDDFADAVDGGESNLKILKLHDIIQRLPPPHYRTAEYLIRHLARIAEHSKRTNMHIQNLAIVWAPNLMRCKEHEGLSHLDSSGSVLHSVGVQAQVTEYLIRYHDMIFNSKMPPLLRSKGSPRRTSAASRPQSMAVSTPAARMAAVPGPDGRRLPDTARLKVIDLNANPIPQYHTVIDHRPGQKRKLKFGIFGGSASSGNGSVSSASSARVKRSSGSDDSTQGGSTRSMGWVTTIRRGRRAELPHPDETHGPLVRAAPVPPPILPGDRRSKLRSVRSAESLLASDTVSSQPSRRRYETPSTKAVFARHPGVPAPPPPPSVTTARHLKPSKVPHAPTATTHQHQHRKRGERAPLQQPPPPPPPLVDSRRTAAQRATKEYSPSVGSRHLYSYDVQQKPLAIVNPCTTFSSNEPVRSKAGSVPPKRTPLATFDDDDWFCDPLPAPRPLGSRVERREKGMSRSFDDTFLLADSAELMTGEKSMMHPTDATTQSLGACSEPTQKSLSLTSTAQCSSPPIESTVFNSSVIYETSLVSAAVRKHSHDNDDDTDVLPAFDHSLDDDREGRSILDSSMSSAGAGSPGQLMLTRNAFSTPSLPTVVVGESPEKWTNNRASYIHVESSGEEGDGSIVSWHDVSRPLDKISEASGSSLVGKQTESARSIASSGHGIGFCANKVEEREEVSGGTSHVLSIAIDEPQSDQPDPGGLEEQLTLNSSPLSLESASPGEHLECSSGRRSSVSPRIKVDPKMERTLVHKNKKEVPVTRSISPESMKLAVETTGPQSTPSPPYTFSMAHDLLQSMNAGGAQQVFGVTSVPPELRKSVYDNLGSSPGQSPSRSLHPLATTSELELDLDNPIPPQQEGMSLPPPPLMMKLQDVKLPQPEVAVLDRAPTPRVAISKAHRVVEHPPSHATLVTFPPTDEEKIRGFEVPLPMIPGVGDEEDSIPPPIPPHQGRAGSAPPTATTGTPKIPVKPAVPVRKTPPLLANSGPAVVSKPPMNNNHQFQHSGEDSASGIPKRKGSSRIADRLAVFESQQQEGAEQQVPPVTTYVAELRMSGRMKSSPNFEPVLPKRTPPSSAAIPVQQKEQQQLTGSSPEANFIKKYVPGEMVTTRSCDSKKVLPSSEQRPKRPQDVPIPPPILTRKPFAPTTPEREAGELVNSPLFKKQFQKLGDERLSLDKAVDIQIYDV